MKKNTLQKTLLFSILLLSLFACRQKAQNNNVVLQKEDGWNDSVFCPPIGHYIHELKAIDSIVEVKGDTIYKQIFLKHIPAKQEHINAWFSPDNQVWKLVFINTRLVSGYYGMLNAPDYNLWNQLKENNKH